MSNELGFLSRTQAPVEINAVEDHPAYCRWQPSTGSSLYTSIDAWLAARDVVQDLVEQTRVIGRELTQLKRDRAFAVSDFDKRKSIDAKFAEKGERLNELVQRETQAQAKLNEAETAVATIEAELNAYDKQVQKMTRAAGNVVFNDGAASVEAGQLQRFLAQKADYIILAIGRPLLPQPV